MALAPPSLSPSRHCFDRFDTPQSSPLRMDHTIGAVHLVPTPDFVFPARPSQAGSAPSPTHKRPVSMHLNLSPPPPRQRAQGQSVSVLPSFSFNPGEASTPSQHSPELSGSPTMPFPTTPSRSMGHRRRASEFVGGDSRYGTSTLVSTSPAKLPDSLPLPSELPITGSPARRGHAHRRSAAISGHDLASILQPRDANQIAPVAASALSEKEDMRIPLPSHLPQSEEYHTDPALFTFAPASTSPDHTSSPLSTRPPSRPRVGFSENVEYIPRPLSTISSDTTSSISTVRGHSVGNSVSSLISLGGTGTPSPRRTRTPPSMLPRPGASHRYRASLDSRPVQEYQDEAWRTFGERPVSETAATSPNMSITIDEPDMPRLHPKRNSFLKLDRRRSEPLIFGAAGTLEQPGLSSVSLQDPVMSAPFQARGDDDESTGTELNRKSSRRRVKDWANAFLGRKARDPRKTKSMLVSPGSLPSLDHDALQDQPCDSPDGEPDLDAVFSQDPFEASEVKSDFSFVQGHTDFPTFHQPEENDNLSPGSMIDLDAALGPYGTPSMTGGRRQMHSGGFGRRGGAHNRTYSLPALTPFKFDKESSPVQSAMADVFEEDEDLEPMSLSTDQPNVTVVNEIVDSDDEEGTGIEIVDAVNEQDELHTAWGPEQGLGIRPEDTSAAPLLAVPSTNMRRKSVIEDTIFEETSPVEVVEDYEEPRTSSLTKSSESSDSTILAESRNLTVPTAEPSPMTPVSIATSAFSSPDYHSHQGFFDPARLGTSASSMTDNRTLSSFATGDHGLDIRTSVDDVPSLTSSRSTMISALHHSFPRDRRDFSDRSGSVISVPLEVEVAESRRKRSSMQSLGKLVGVPFGESRTRSPAGQRPQTAVPEGLKGDSKKRKENRLSKLMFWRSKSDTRNASSSTK